MHQIIILKSYDEVFLCKEIADYIKKKGLKNVTLQYQATYDEFSTLFSCMIMGEVK